MTNQKKDWKVISLYLIIYDLLTINVAYMSALLLRFDMQFSTIPKIYLNSFISFVPLYAIFAVFVYYMFRLYKIVWTFASFRELNRIIIAVLITTILHFVVMTAFFRRMPVSYYIIGSVLQFLFTATIRFLYRYVDLLRRKYTQESSTNRNAMIVGGGQAGAMIIRELYRNGELDVKPVCVIDDNPNKWNRYIEDVLVVGGRHTIVDNVKKYKIDQILFAIPSASKRDKFELLSICNETGCEIKSLPGIYQLAKGDVSIKNMKIVEIEDLLGRDSIELDTKELFEYLNEKTVLVTGGGGSIGSELCMQIIEYNPKKLIIFDIYENSVYELQQKIFRKYPNTEVTVLIGSVRDEKRIQSIFEKYKPDIVYHAAAHKHVPLMEDSPNEAIKNNVIGTYNTAKAAFDKGAKKFILISTDKAVNPTNIMGASKRLCEMIIQAMDRKSKKLSAEIDKDSVRTQFVAVRFGNVLGSNGSVIPLFKQQIEEGGPVTVTHPEINRFFMTIKEAVGLVLQASCYAEGGEIFILDMGEPVKIDTLARNIIKLSGYRPDIDIKIKYTGLRPGEKLYEEKLMEEEGLRKTKNKLIHIGKPIPIDDKWLLEKLDELEIKCKENSDDINQIISEIVPTYNYKKEDK